MRKLMTLLASLFVVILLLPSVAQAATDDTRQVVTEVNLTYDELIPSCGEMVKCWYDGEPEGAVYRMSSFYWRWSRQYVANNQQVNPSSKAVFVPGTWFYMYQIRVDGEFGSQYRLPDTKEELTIKINGVERQANGNPSIGSNYSYVWVYSPDYEVTDEGAALGWWMPGLYADNCYVPDSYMNVPISTINFGDYTYGGEKPYSYSKVSGPSWLTVDSEGKITGTPTVTGNNDPLVVRITDHAGAYLDISLSVNKTYVRPEDRTVVKDVQGTAEGGIAPSYGQMCVTPVIDVPDGVPYFFNVHMGSYWKLGEHGEEDATRVSIGDTFYEGQYFYQVQIRIDGDDGSNYRFPTLEEGGMTSIIVDGEEWTVEGAISVNDTFSCFTARSPVYTVTKELTDPELKITNVTLSLQDNLSFNLYSPKSLYAKEGYGTPYIVFNVNGREVTANPNPALSTDELYAFTCNDIAPHRIGDDVGFTVYVMNGSQRVKGMTASYAVTRYCSAVLAGSTAKDKLSTLVVDLLNYGAAAQEYMNYKTDALVNASLTSEQQSWATAGRDYVSVGARLNADEADLEGVAFSGAALYLNETVAIRYVFTAESLSGLTLEMTDDQAHAWTFTGSDFRKVTDPGAAPNSYYVDFRKLHAGRMSDRVYATFHQGGKKSVTIAYSIETYVKLAGGGTGTFQNLMKAMMKYGDAAKAYAEP